VKAGFLTLATFYGPFLNTLSHGRLVHEFSYDWRRECAENNMRLERFIEDVIQNHSGPAKAVQVVAHSMGCLITLPLLNRRPELFHSVLFAAAAYKPGIGFMQDVSEPGNGNMTGPFNKTMFTPQMWLSCPSPFHFFPLADDKNDLGGSFLQEANGDPVQFDLHDLQDCKRLKLGPYHPNSKVPESHTESSNVFFGELLRRAQAYRQLLKYDPNVTYPPIAVLRSDCAQVTAAYKRPSSDAPFDFQTRVEVPGDGRVSLVGALPPDGIPVHKVVTINASHADVLNNDASIQLLDELIEEAKRRK